MDTCRPPEVSVSRLLVLDFDGTMTDAEVEGLPFRRGYLEDLALVCGRPLPEVERRAAEVEAELAGIAGEVGWLFEGRIVAPATVDPYLRMMPVARRLLDEAGRLMDETDRTRVLDGIFYKYNYQKTTIAFRPGASEVLRSLSGTATYVVTNSHTDAVQHKIRSLGARPEGAMIWSGWPSA
jgi:FMN phosphatase YigB (HAD superfamily)